MLYTILAVLVTTADAKPRKTAVVEPASAPAKPSPPSVRFAPELARAKELREIPWSSQSPTVWGETAELLRPAADAWLEAGPDADGLRVLWETGRAAELSGQPRTPFYQELRGTVVNHYWQRAAWWVAADPALRSGFEPEALAQLDRLGSALPEHP